MIYRRLERLAAFAAVSLLILVCAGCAVNKSRPYPIGIYGVGSKENLPILKTNGFNVVRGPASEEFLDAARENGLGVLASPGTSAGPGFNADRARSVVTVLDSHEALWGWYLVDEPDLRRVPPEQVVQAQRFLKNIPARKPTALVLFQGAEAENYGNIADITMIDRYPVPWLPLANFEQHVRMTRLALDKDEPLIAVVQSFDWSYYSDLLPGYEGFRPPTESELRCMVYGALAQGADGIFFYAYDAGGWRVYEHPKTWSALKNVVAEMNKRMPLFKAEHLWWPYIHKFEGGEKGFNEALASCITPALLRVDSGNADLPEGEYILLVNNSDRRIEYKVLLPRENDGLLRVLGEDRWIITVNGWLSDEFAPYAVHVYGPLSGADQEQD
ncbi:MAG: hypothetical protein K9N48_07740 [Verrucomicrobia bacterium]|nr:hypothetical protein [Verrucomicrobiota bacterium]MCF7708080.1 hypothetical protein [Verrucomicrobiota bacterium]